MKQCCIILLVLVMVTAVFTACTNENIPEAPSATQTTQPTPQDFSGVDFTGTWSVSQVKDSNGEAISTDKLKEIGADFTIELTGDGMYIISDADGKEIGQGTYSVAQNALTLTASGGNTVYTIQDENTISSPAADGSITIMARCCVDTTEDEGEQATTSPEA